MWLQFQQSYCLFLWWVPMAQRQYWNMDKSCEGILPQGKGLHISRKVRKIVAIKLANQFFLVSLWRKYWKKDRDSEKGTWLKKWLLQTYFL